MMDNQQPKFLIKNKKLCLYALIGTLLGDGSIEKKTNSLAIMHSIKNEDYLTFKHREFSRFINTGKIGYSKNWGTNPNKELRIGIRFRIYQKKLIYRLKKIMYDNENKKLIPNFKYIKPITLFFWYLDDGCFIKRDNKRYIRRSLRISLASYNDNDILSLIKNLYSNYGIKFRPEYNKNKDKILKICIESYEAINNFLLLLSPFKDYIPNSLAYKFII